MGAKAFAVRRARSGSSRGGSRGSHFRVGIFTNLSRDHLDYHHTMEAYADAEGNPFPLARTRRGGGECRRSFKRALCGDGSGARHSRLDDGARGKGEALRKRFRPRTRSMPVTCRSTGRGMAFTLRAEGETREVSLPAVGLFNVDNALEVIAAMLALGYPLDDIVQGSCGARSALRAHAARLFGRDAARRR